MLDSAGRGRVSSWLISQGPHSSEVGRRLRSSEPGTGALYSELTIFKPSPYTGSLLASLSIGIRYYCTNAGNYQSFRIQVGSSNLRLAPRSYPYQALLLAWRAVPESST